jgi:hypothetical protein
MALPFGHGHQLAPATLRRYNPKDGHSRPAHQEVVAGRLENPVALVTGYVLVVDGVFTAGMRAGVLEPLGN